MSYAASTRPYTTDLDNSARARFQYPICAQNIEKPRNRSQKVGV